MTPVHVSQSELQCPKCAGQCVYAPDAGGLRCESCGNIRAIDSGTEFDAQSETAYDPDTPQQELPRVHGDKVFQCETCGGEVVFIGHALYERCPYCNGPVVLSSEESSFETMALIPFKVDQVVARRNAIDWIKKRRAAPNDLADCVGKAHVAGLYAPFWTFDSNEAVRYWARLKNAPQSTRFGIGRTSGNLSIGFDDLLAPASPHVTPLIRDGIMHDFAPDQLRPYMAGYIAGFAAERHNQSVAEGLRANAADKDLLIRSWIRFHIQHENFGRGIVKELCYKTDTTGIRYRRILLPIWILHYSYQGAAYKVVVSGIDGRTFGERPLSRMKLLWFSAGISAAALVFGMISGAGLVS